MTAEFIDCVLCKKFAENISTSVYPCKCGDDVTVKEYVCFACGCTFELVDGELIGEPVDTISEVMSIVSNGDINPEEFLAFVDNMSKELHTSAGEADMSSLTHTCLKCSSVCFDNGAGVISCKCGFEWEVIRS